MLRIYDETRNILLVHYVENSHYSKINVLVL